MPVSNQELAEILEGVIAQTHREGERAKAQATSDYIEMIKTDLIGNVSPKFLGWLNSYDRTVNRRLRKEPKLSLFSRLVIRLIVWAFNR